MKIQLAVDRPRAGVPIRSYAGYLEVTGWAAASEAITDIRVRAIDDDGPGTWARAIHGQPRPDVAQAHPKLIHSDRSGFRAMVPATDARRLEIRVEAGSKPKVREIVVDIDSEIRQIAVEDTDASSCPWCGCDEPRSERTDTREGPFRLVACGRCEFAFADPLPSAADLARIYEIEYWENSPFGTDVLYASADTDFICGLVEQHGNGGRRALEVGCGQGTLVYGLKHKGFDIRGQDLSQNAARQIEQEAGIPIWRAPLREIDDSFAAGKFDVIITRHVIEHSITPRADLQWMRENLSDGGIIVLLTPNHGSLAAELLGATWEWFVPPIHVGYFSPRSLELVGDVAGLDLRMLMTREGDGAPLIPTLKAFLDYERDHLSEPRLSQLREALAAAAEGAPEGAPDGTPDGSSETGPGRGQELIAVLAAL